MPEMKVCLVLLQMFGSTPNAPTGEACLHVDGTVEFSGNMTPDAAARQFWDYVKQNINAEQFCRGGSYDYPGNP